MANDIIDINVYETVETVEITVNPNLTTVNINQVTGGGGVGATDLGYIATPTNGTVTSSTGSGATIPLADGTNAGLLTPAEKTKIANSVPYTGATSDVNLGEFGIQLGNLEFDNTPTNIPTTAGSVYYNDADGTLDLILKGGNVTLQVGQETVIRVVNKTATSVSLLQGNYQAVRITGAQGQRPKVDLAQATNDVLSAETIGLVTETITNNQEGFITTSGLVRNINTTGSLQGETWLDGDILYLSPTIAGSITKVKPTAPNHLIIIGYVISAHITQGTIFVKVDNGYELDELHNVKIATPANNSVLAYTLATDIWENKTVETALGYTPYNATNPSDYQTASQVQTIADAKVANTITNGVTTSAPNQDVVFDALALKANDANVVHLTGAETIAGIKTFSSNPIIPATGSELILSVGSGGVLNGLTTSTYASPFELTYLKGVTSAIQTQLNSKQASNANLTGLSALSYSGSVPFVRMYGTNLFSLDTSTYLTSVGIANLTATGTPSATTYLRGDNTWSTIPSGATNLTYTPSPTNGIVVSDTGTDATLPLADATNAGLLKPAKFTVLENTSGTNTGDNAVNSLYSGLATSKQDKITLTTTGTSGAATLTGATLNIPQYSGATNLGYNASPTNGTVTSSTGSSAIIPLADITNAGLLKPAKFTVLENTSGTNTGDNATNTQYSGLATSKQDTLSGTGFVKSTAGTISYDTNAYTIANTAITAGTNTKITYDAKGLVTAGTSLIATDIPTITQAQVTNLTTDLAAKAPLASPTFTGTPSLPTGTTGVTQTAGDNTTKLATTAFVTSALSSGGVTVSPQDTFGTANIATVTAAQYAAFVTAGTVSATTLYFITA